MTGADGVGVEASGHIIWRGGKAVGRESIEKSSMEIGLDAKSRGNLRISLL
jgi:hypothetical protein